METAQLMELLERRNSLEKEWAKLKEEFLNCPKCMKLASDRLTGYHKQIIRNNKRFEDSMTDGSVFIKDPSNANRELQRKIVDLKNCKGLTACSDSHKEKAILINDKITMIMSIDKIVDRVN